ncbi:hypothetical protein JIX58_02390 [Brevundimonas diminuta]|uniref:hypothetical protein n=1 Tax=Brevundimonas TaxID=41275 RepID=UPI00190608B3|nr:MULTISPECIES: hypothetical protein [Brevundimonas]MBK1967941.1 hypothetical protein [Brevundimonas diminuta]MBK1974591.1 hypothetical protein [Brevundimonas diminuta]
MTDVQPNDPNRNPREAPDLDGDEVEAGRRARKSRANQDPLANNNPADRSPSPSTGGDGAAGAGGPKGFGTGA